MAETRDAALNGKTAIDNASDEGDLNLGAHHFYHPDKGITEHANVTAYMHKKGFTTYEELYNWTIANPEQFWGEMASELEWFQPWDKVLDDSKAPFFKWFVGGKTNIVYNAIDRHVKTWRRNKLALIWEGEDGSSRTFSYHTLNREVSRMANVLKSMGVKRGDIVTIYLPRIPELPISMLACAKIGAAHSVVYGGFSVEALADRMADAQSKVLITADGGYMRNKIVELKQIADEAMARTPTLQNCIVVRRTGHNVNMESGRDLWLHDLLALPIASANCPTEQVDAEEPLFILYTSGTTGRPKGVMYSHRGAYLNALGEALEVGLDNTSVYLWTLPMFHCNGWCFTWGVTAVGGTNLCLRKIDPGQVVQLIAEERVSHFCGAPTVLILLLNHPAIKELKLPRPLRVVTAGAPPAPTTIQAVEALGASITHVYGLTETYGPHSICAWHSEWDALPIEERARLKARQGVPYIHAAEMRVVDERMRDVPADGATMGEVVMRGNNLMKGYYLQPEDTATAFRGGWFHSGDVAVMHPDGYIELRDRKKDVIISGGENISTIEVEQALYQHPDVFEVAVVSRPDELWGEVPVAYVTLKAGSALTEAGLIAFCRERLAHYKCPKAIHFGDLPKTSTGKIQKFRLREQEWAGKEKRIN